MYTSPVSLILGFHGCDREVGEKILGGEVTHLSPSENSYDWLGHGIYFWEHNPERALAFAEELRDRPRQGKRIIKTPYVLGAVIDPGHCLNLLESEALRLVSDSYRYLKQFLQENGSPLPVNKRDPQTGELLQRYLDCAVINTLHQLRLKEKRPSYDTVRGVFEEGDSLYDGAGFKEKTHVQICVRNLSSIKGYFRLLPDAS